jgi:hypothetical protein
LARADVLGIAHEVDVVDGARHVDLIVLPYSERIVLLAAPFVCDHMIAG